MIFYRYKNCNHYKTDERKVKSIFYSKPKTKNLREGTCTAWRTVFGEYLKIKSNCWCER